MSAARTLVASLSVVVLLSLPSAAQASHTVLELLSAGPVAGPTQPYDNVSFQWASADGSSVIFETDEPLVAADVDEAMDVYRRAGATTTLVSSGEMDQNAYFGKASKDGSRVFFVTDESLDAADGDAVTDVYEWRLTDATPRLLSDRRVAGTDAARHVQIDAVSEDGTRVFFHTEEPLLAEDGDADKQDTYKYENGTLTLVTTAALGHTFVDAISADGRRAFFGTSDKVDAANDDDTYGDIYLWRDGITTLISDDAGADTDEDEDDHATLQGVSRDGTRIVFEHGGQITPDDPDDVKDLFLATESAGWEPTLLSDGTHPGMDTSFGAADPDLNRVLFTSMEALTADDADTESDVYSASLDDPSPTLVSRPDAGGVAIELAGTSEDLSHVALASAGALDPADTDGGQPDLFLVSGATTTLLSGTATTPVDASFTVGAVSADGRRVFFDTDAPLVPEDADDAADVYASIGGRLVLISRGPTGARSARSARGVIGGSTGPESYLRALTSDEQVVFIESDGALTADDTDGGGFDVFSARFPAHQAPDDGNDDGTPQTTPLPVQRDTGDTLRPTISLSGSKRQRALRQRAIVVRVRANEASKLVLSGTVKVRGTKKALRLSTLRTSLAAGKGKTLKLRLSKKLGAAIRKGLARRRAVTATLTVAVTDAAGNRSTKKVAIRLVR